MAVGQAQLLAFARIFLKDPIVILDEASSRDRIQERSAGFPTLTNDKKTPTQSRQSRSPR